MKRERERESVCVCVSECMSGAVGDICRDMCLIPCAHSYFFIFIVSF